METKKCIKCETEKTLTEFPLSSGEKRRNVCQACRTKRAMEIRNGAPTYASLQPIPKEGHQFCTKCGEEKPTEDFGKRRKTCKVCIQKEQKAYHQTHLVEIKKKAKEKYDRTYIKKEKYVPPEGYKLCTVCGELKTVDNFQKWRGRCKECKSMYDKQYRKDRIILLQQYDLKEDKMCIKCKKIMSYDLFEKGRNVCKLCRSTDRLERYKKNKEHEKETSKKWLKTENGKTLSSASRFKRRTTLKSAIYDLTESEWIEIKTKQNGKCARCGKQEPEIKLTKDHIFPVSLGGNHTKSNIQGLCHRCNSKKNAKIDSLGFEIFLKGMS